MGCHFLSPGDLPDPGIEPVSPALAGGFFTTEPPGKPPPSGIDISQDKVCCSSGSQTGACISYLETHLADPTTEFPCVLGQAQESLKVLACLTSNQVMTIFMVLRSHFGILVCEDFL